MAQCWTYVGRLRGWICKLSCPFKKTYQQYPEVNQFLSKYASCRAFAGSTKKHFLRQLCPPASPVRLLLLSLIRANKDHQVQVNWVVSGGAEKTYGIQSAIVAAAFFMIIGLQFFGGKLRRMQGPMNFKTQ